VSSFDRQPVPDAVAARMQGRSLRLPCPVRLDELALLRITHLGLDGALHPGELIVHATLADEVLEIFGDLLAARFPIARVQLVDHYDGDDHKSMADNNTSAFNCRPNLTQPHLYSRHSWGCAVDVNPVLNPYVAGGSVLPPEGSDYLVRAERRPGMIAEGDACHTAFTRRGWCWGGAWRDRIDYQHFEKDPPR
jgi:hypothetical protein